MVAPALERRSSPAERSAVPARDSSFRRLRRALRGVEDLAAGSWALAQVKRERFKHTVRRTILRVVLGIVAVFGATVLIIACVLMTLYGLAAAISTLLSWPMWGGVLVVGIGPVGATAIAVQMSERRWRLRETRHRERSSTPGSNGVAESIKGAQSVETLDDADLAAKLQIEAGRREIVDGLSSPGGLTLSAAVGYLIARNSRFPALARIGRLLVDIVLGLALRRRRSV